MEHGSELSESGFQEELLQASGNWTMVCRECLAASVHILVPIASKELIHLEHLLSSLYILSRVNKLFL